MQATTKTKNLVAGLSGPSSSGKTSLARLLRSVLDGLCVPISLPDPVPDPVPVPGRDGCREVATVVVVERAGGDEDDEEEDQDKEEGKGKGKGGGKVSISLVVLHEDDFYKPDEDIPITTTPETKRRLQDWDCAESLNLPLLERTLRHFHLHGRLPRDLESKEDQNPHVDAADLSSLVSRYRDEVASSVRSVSRSPPRNAFTTASTTSGSGDAEMNDYDGGDDGNRSDPDPDTNTDTNVTININICILDGFLLYPNPNPSPSSPSSSSSSSFSSSSFSSSSLHHLRQTITPLLSPKLFLRSTLTLTISRRHARHGCYATQSGFWFDPDGYVEEVVWPNYRRQHAWMFDGGDVEAGEVLVGLVGRGRKERKGKEKEEQNEDEEGEEEEEEREGKGDGVIVAPGKGEKGLDELLEWAVGIFDQRVKRELVDILIRAT